MKTLLMMSLLAGTLVAQANFLPKNDLKFPVGMKVKEGGLTEKEFNEVADAIYSLYYPVFKSKGGDFYIDRKWSDATVNAYADMKGPLRKVTIFGGMARAEAMTKDAFSLVVCHEVGHHLGGAPKSLTDSWASIEGEADYFAVLKCLRKLWADDENAEIVNKMKVPKFLKESCEKQKFPGGEEAICLRSGMAGLDLAKLFAFMSSTTKFAQYQTPDTLQVAQTYLGHPNAQCRLDTFFQGVLCDKSFSEDLSDVDEAKGACHALNGDSVGLRPRCWFKPRSR